MGAEPPSNMGFFEKIRKYPLYCLYKLFLYTIIIIIVFFIEKFLFKFINLIFHFWFISLIIVIILNLWLLRYLVLKIEFAALSFVLRRIVQYNRIGKREAIFLHNELTSLNSAIDIVFDQNKPVEELRQLSVIQKNVKLTSEIIKNYYKLFTKMKIKFNALTVDQQIFYKNITNLYNSFEQSEFLKLLNNTVKQLRAEKKALIRDLSVKEKEKIDNEKLETQKYMKSIKESLLLLLDQINDYIGENYCICKPRYIRNFFKNDLFASLHQFHVELDNYYIYEEKRLKTKDGNTLDYIIINNNTGNNNNLDKKLMIICGPNAEPYQVFCRNIIFNKYLSKGIDVLCWNYRGYGFSTGKPSFNNLRSDIIEIYEEVQKLNIYKKIGVHGISIGGVSCCYLANQKKDICLLVSDRNFGQIEYIVRNNSIGKYLEFLYKFLLIPSSRNVEYYIENDAHKIIFNDPNDEIVTEEGSLKTLLSEELCKRYLELNLNGSFISISNNSNITDNSIEMETLDEANSRMLSNTSKKMNNSNDNLLNDIIISPSLKNNTLHDIKNKSALDIILLDNKEKFIECLINITEALKNEKLNYKKKSFCKLLKIFNKSENEENYSQLKEEEFQNSISLCDFIKSKMNSILEKFTSAGDNLCKLITKNTKYHQKLFIENFFNNLFIWGTYDKRDDYGCVYHSTEYIDIMLSKVISMLNLFLNSQEIASYKNINIIKVIETFYNYLAKIKNNLKFLGIKAKNGFVYLSDGNNYEKKLIQLGRGNLVYLNCGHNGILSNEENIVFKHYLKESDLFKKVKKEKNGIINNKDDIDDSKFGDENIFNEDLDSSISNLN